VSGAIGERAPWPVRWQAGRLHQGLGIRIAPELHSLARAPWAAAFSPDGRSLAVGDEIKRVTLWDLEKKTSRELLGHTDAVYSVAFNPRGDRLASAGKDKRSGSGTSRREVRRCPH